METVANSHITIDSSGVARIDDSRMKVIHIIKEMRARRSSPEQLHQAFPRLSLSQIHAALAYYYDHQPQVDSQIELELREFDQARAADKSNPLKIRLRSTE